MRIAILADIHGNPVALDVVLKDIERRGRRVDTYWVLGDIVALGHDPVAVLERLAWLPARPGSAPRVQCIRGNTERYVCAGDRPLPRSHRWPPTLRCCLCSSRRRVRLPGRRAL